VSGDNPTTLTGQPEETNRLADWVNEAWMDIQLSKPDWQWMRSSFSFATVNGQISYTSTEAGLTDFASWDRDTLRNYVTASGTNSETMLDYMDYDAWRDTYLFGANRGVYTRPNMVTITPNKSLAFGPIAASGYTIVGDYFKIPTEMVADTDTPSLPTQYHMAIVYRAMMFYGAYEAAQEVFNEGEAEFARMMARLSASRLTEVTFGGALA